MRQSATSSVRCIVAKVSAVLERVTNVLMIVSIASVVLLILIQVVLRYVFGRPLFWVEELSRYLLLWSVFLSMSRGMKIGAFPSIEILVGRLSEQRQKTCFAVQKLLVLVFTVMMVREGSRLLSLAKLRNQLSPALRMPMAWVYLCIPIGGGILGFQILADAITRGHETMEHGNGHGDEDDKEADS